MKLRFRVASLLLASAFMTASLASCGGKKSLFETDADDVSGVEAPLNNSVGSSALGDVYASANDNAIQGVSTKTNSSGGKNVNYNPTASSTNIVLESNNTARYKIVTLFASGSSAMTEINSFASDLKSKTGATFSVTNVDASTATIGGKQIVIGYSRNIRDYVGDFGFKSATGGVAIASGQTIYIGVGSIDALPGIFDYFLEQVKVTSGSDYGITSNLKISSDLCAISEHMPLFTNPETKSSPTQKARYSAGGGNYQLTYTGDVYAADVKIYNDQLIAAGYILKQKNTIQSNSFYTFVKGDTMVHINYFATIKQYSIVYGPKTYDLASSKITDYQKLVTPSITQTALYNTGQCNVIQLEDGSFVIVDSGRAKGKDETENHDSEILMNFLNSKKPASHSKPKVIWMLTHAHSDHVNMARDNFFPTYKNQIDLQLVCFNFPDFTVLDQYLPSGATWGESSAQSAYATTVNKVISSVKTNFPKAKFYTFHTGDIIYLPGCEIEILHTHEDMYLKGFKDVNDTSSVFRFIMQGRTFMVYGDATARVNETIYDRYESALKADIIQISHHGVNACMTLEIAKANDPDICFWPVRKQIYDSDRVNGGAANAWLKATSGSDGQRTRKHYNQNYTVTVSIPNMTVTTKQWYTGGTSTDLTGREYVG